MQLNNDPGVHAQFFRRSRFVLFFLLISRLLSMYFVPLNDSTEARYGEIARIMQETGNWITPMHHYGVPFWAKPPLSTWLSAIAMKWFGVNELVVRLPGLLLSIGILWLVWNIAKKRSGELVAMTAVLVLAGSFYFFLDAGTVMTDPALLFCTTLIITAFWQAVVNCSKPWAYLFFVGLGLGLLAKGPIALVLTGMPIFIWIVWHQQWRAVWQRLPWIWGTLLMLAIALPWYLLAEASTPGFINYFIIGEHFYRFLKPGWDGDKYGFAHIAPYGMIWVYMLIGIMPWTLLIGPWLVRHCETLPKLCKDNDGWVHYLLLCTFVPLIFFTFARNIIYPYVFPCLPAFALLFAEIAHRKGLMPRDQQRIVSFAAISGIIFLIGTALFIVKPELIAKSQNRVVAAWKNYHPAPGSRLIYWASKLEYSAQFYSTGIAEATLNAAVLEKLLSNALENYVVTDSDIHVPLPKTLLPRLTKVTSVQILKRHLDIYKYIPPTKENQN